MAKPTSKTKNKKEGHLRQADRLKQSIELGYDVFNEGLTLKQIHENVQYMYQLRLQEEREEKAREEKGIDPA